MAIIEPIEQSRNNKGKGKRLVKKYYGMRNTLFDWYGYRKDMQRQLRKNSWL